MVADRSFEFFEFLSLRVGVGRQYLCFVLRIISSLVFDIAGTKAEEHSPVATHFVSLDILSSCWLFLSHPNDGTFEFLLDMGL
jgi:hypothetical protein